MSELLHRTTDFARAERLSLTAVNVSETVSALADQDIREATTRQMIQALGVPVISFDESLAVRAGELRRSDRACLATAELLSASAVTGRPRVEETEAAH